MSDTLSPNTQAILLLTAPLIVGRAASSERPLTAGDYNRLAVHLRDTKRQPADFLTAHADDVIRECKSLIDETRVKRLLGRGFLLSQAVEHWHSRAIWVISRADAAYPRRLKARLGGAAPAVLYGCGNVLLLETGGLAVVGSRKVDESLIAYTEAIDPPPLSRTPQKARECARSDPWRKRSEGRLRRNSRSRRSGCAGLAIAVSGRWREISI